MSDPTDQPVTMKSPDGVVTDVPSSQVDVMRTKQWTIEGGSARADRVAGDVREAQTSPVQAVAHGILQTGTLGAFDVGARILGGEDEGIKLRHLDEAHPTANLIGNLAGGFLPGGAISKVGGLAREAFAVGSDASALARIGGAVKAGVTEGAAIGGGQGVSDVALSDDPLNTERWGSTIGSQMLYGGLTGGVGAGLFKSAEVGLSKAGAAIREGTEAAAAQRAIPEDLAALDDKGLRAARDVEVESIGKAKDAEIEQLTTAKKAQAAQLADDIDAFRSDTKAKKIFLATKDVDAKGIGEVKQMARVAFDADKQFDRALNRGGANLAENLRPVLGTLQQQENALTRIVASEPELRAAFAADATNARADSLGAIPNVLNDNRALQARIRDVIAKPVNTIADTSPRLTAIEDAREALKNAPPKSFAQKAVEGGTFGAVTALAHPLGIVAPFLGEEAKKAVGSLFKRFSGANVEIGARTGKAVDAFMNVSTKLQPIAPVLATKVLAAVRYAPPQKGEPEPTGREKLPALYKARTDEIKSQVTQDPTTGAPMMRPQARQLMAKELDGIRAADPIFADRLETLGALKLTFLASRMPTRPDLGGMQTGPDHWQPSDMEMRTFARYAAAVEDPGGIEERLAHGTVTPEDAEVMREVFPERMAHIQASIITRLPELQQSLPYQRRLAWSIFSGVPIDASMHPNIMAVLQGSFEQVAPDTTADIPGMQAPKIQPHFGSLGSMKSLDKPTPAESRAG